MAAWLLMMVMAGNGEEPTRGTKEPPKVALQRVPHKGIQPQVAVDAIGKVHLIYFSGDPGHGDLYYVRLEKGQKEFSDPIRINHGPGSAVAIGNMRGAQLAIGKNNQVHVAWMGTDKAIDKGPRGEFPMLHTRLNDKETAFEKERNVIKFAYGLDGGGSLAADGKGNVYVSWHASKPGTEGEGDRCVWIAQSTDCGKTFAPEKQAFLEPTGACGCCGMRAFADNEGRLYVLYRSAQEAVHRDMYLLVSPDPSKGFDGIKIHEWEAGTCPASTAAFYPTADGTWAAWETRDQVYFARIHRGMEKRLVPIAAPGEGKRRKYPVIAENERRETILVWTEGMGWEKGGSVAWQVFDKDGKPTSEKGQKSGVPTWSLVAVFARPTGGFTILY